jgi:hypothetical protein
VEPDWYEEEEPAHEVPRMSATDVAPVLAPVPEPEAVPMVAAETAPEVRVTPAVEPAPEAGPAPVAEEETMLWFGRTPPAMAEESPPDAGADEIEVVGPPSGGGPAHRPGSRELADALAALDALAPPTEATPATRTPAAEERGSQDESLPPTVGSEAAPLPTANEEPELPAGAAGSLTSLTRPTAPPATRAYRRLRRIFPG